MASVFVSYRREDSSHVVGRLNDRLVERFGRDRVFYDVQSIGFGQDFRQVIAQTLANVDVVLVVIGPGWSPERLANPADYLRFEIREALAQNKLVIPVLVDRAEMPNPDVLPADIEQLAYKNAAKIRRDPDFFSDSERLLATVEAASTPGGSPSGPPSGGGPAPASGRRKLPYYLASGVAAVLVLALLVAVIDRDDTDADDETQEAAGGDDEVDDPATPTTEDSTTTTSTTTTTTTEDEDEDDEVVVTASVSARADLVEVPGGNQTRVDVLANDALSGPGTDQLSITSAPSLGNAFVTVDNIIIYEPAVAVWGDDQLSYEICRGTVCDGAQVTIELSEQNCLRPTGFVADDELAIEFRVVTSPGTDDGTTDDLVLQPTPDGPCVLLPTDMPAGSEVSSRIGLDRDQYSYCGFTGFRWVKPVGSDGIDDPWLPKEIYYEIDGGLWFNRVADDSGVITGGTLWRGGGYDGTADYIERCG